MVLLTTCVYLLINFVYLSNNFKRFDMFPRIRARMTTRHKIRRCPHPKLKAAAAARTSHIAHCPPTAAAAAAETAEETTTVATSTAHV